IVTQYFWPESFRINDLALGLAELGHAVTVLTGQPKYPEGQYFRGHGPLGPYREVYGPVEVLRVPLLTRGGGGGARLAMNYLAFVLSASLLGPLRCRGAFDAILVYEPSPVTVGVPARMLKAIKGAPILFWVQDLWPESLSAASAVRSPLILGWVERLVRWIYRGCDRVLVQSEAFAEPVIRLGVPRERVLYYPNFAEAFYRPLPAVQAPEFAALPKGFRVMFAGNIGASQSFETILAAAERLRGQPDIHWVVLGEGRQSAWVAQEVERRGLSGRVHLLGRHPTESMPGWFAHAGAMLVTLKRDPVLAVTVPAKVQSYMACARPIVAALDGEGARVIRSAGAGIAAPAEDAEGLARAVTDMYRMTDAERRAMGARGRQFFEAHFERDMLLHRLDRWLAQVVDEARTCAS
ncbi:MAG TPA: glycosyltransferase family 4 protein, partial [Burkholderiales bacterium]|nr:glycosyltransferase family 4 protein [Burkholderiales bacterium]